MKDGKITISDYIDESVLNISQQYDNLFATGDNEKLFEVIKESESLIGTIKKPLSEMQLYYDIGTGYGELRKLTQSEVHLEKEIFHLRKAVNIFESAKEKRLFLDKEEIISNYLIVLIYVNLGNALRSAQRHIVAIDNYFYALNINPTFSMAYVNLSSTLFEYAAMQEDDIYRNYLNHAAYYYYKKTKEYADNIHNPEAIKS